MPSWLKYGHCKLAVFASAFALPLLRFAAFSEIRPHHAKLGLGQEFLPFEGIRCTSFSQP